MENSIFEVLKSQSVQINEKPYPDFSIILSHDKICRRPESKILVKTFEWSENIENISDLHDFWSEMIAPDFFARPTVRRPRRLA